MSIYLYVYVLSSWWRLVVALGGGGVIFELEKSLKKTSSFAYEHFNEVVDEPKKLDEKRIKKRQTEIDRMNE